ncbi:MAG: HAMP domain-containing protein [Ktedonobacteraceae bacterium]|nr:HAMP domain-containing protein [Ktedonobacteraceae bacterium]
MSPDQNMTGATVDRLLNVGVYLSPAISIVIVVILAFLAFMVPNFLTFAIIGCGVVLLIALIAINLYVRHGVKERIQSLAEVCREFSGGNRTVRAVVAGDDEFAQLSSSVNALFDSQGSSSVNPLSGSGDAAALQAQIEKLLQEVSAVGDGDLRVQAEVTPDTLGVLADSFNYMIEELAKVVGRVQSTAVQVTNATRRILDRSAELAQASETQVTQIAQTTEAVEALAVFIQSVARNAQLSVDAAQDALRNAAKGQEAVRQTIDGMMLIRENVQETSKKIKRLGERSNEIGEIVRIIEDIADQTNLLALNAAIQSAMAGEHGRGFAVVADEIRLLAERSTESTKRIATLVKSIQGDTYEAVVAMEDSTQEVVKGSQLADDAGRSLNSIYSAVERQAQMIESIARAANEQTTVSEAVAVAMSRISEITRQTDAGTQEAALSVSYLAELSEQLRASVSTFRLPERANDEFNSFANMASSASDAPDASGQSFSGMASGDWGQGFGNTFPPLPEPGNTGSLVPLGTSVRGGQLNFDNSQDMGQPNFGSPPAFGGAGFGGQQSYPGFNGQQNGNQFALGAPQFGEQGDMGNVSFDNQQAGNFNNWLASGQFPPAPNFGAPGAVQPNSGLLPPPPQQGQPGSQPPPWDQGQPQQPSPWGQGQGQPQQNQQGFYNPEQRPYRD